MSSGIELLLSKGAEPFQPVDTEHDLCAQLKAILAGLWDFFRGKGPAGWASSTEPKWGRAKKKTGPGFRGLKGAGKRYVRRC
jgi:hypothetical protein